MYVCLCKALTERDVRRAARGGSIAAEALIARLGLAEDDCCGRCAREIDSIVALAAEERIATPTPRSQEGRVACKPNRASWTC